MQAEHEWMEKSVSVLSQLKIVPGPIILCGIDLRTHTHTHTHTIFYLLIHSPVSCNCWTAKPDIRSSLWTSPETAKVQGLGHPPLLSQAALELLLNLGRIFQFYLTFEHMLALMCLL